MRRRIVVVGAFLIVIALILLTLTTQEAFTMKREMETDTWELTDRVLPPEDSTFHARLMTPGMWFQFDVSSTDRIRLTISIVQHDPDTKAPIFDQEGTSFIQKVTVAATGTYWIDIVNVSPSSITLEGGIVSKRLEALPATSSPYALVGGPVMIIGAIVLVYGVLKKPRMLRSKRSDLRKRQ